MAAMAPERSRSLHNFTLPPRLKWGVQRHLRCSKSNPNTDEHHNDNDDANHRRHDGSSSSSSSRIRRRDPDQPPERKRRTFNDHHLGTNGRGEFEAGRVEDVRAVGGIEVVREKLMIDLQTQVDKMKVEILGEGGAGRGFDDRESNHHQKSHRYSPPSQENGGSSVVAVGKEDRPWNLRTRRSVFKEPNSLNGRNLRFEDGGNGSSVVMPPGVVNWGSGGGVGIGGFYVGGSSGGGGDRGERAKFSVPLSRHEIEEDFMALTGRRPPRKPKRRPKYVQKQLDTLFPGLWLSEITADMYKVNDVPEPGKIQ